MVPLTTVSEASVVQSGVPVIARPRQRRTQSLDAEASSLLDVRSVRRRRRLPCARTNDGQVVGPVADDDDRDQRLHDPRELYTGERCDDDPDTGDNRQDAEDLRPRRARLVHIKIGTPDATERSTTAGYRPLVTRALGRAGCATDRSLARGLPSARGRGTLAELGDVRPDRGGVWLAAVVPMSQLEDAPAHRRGCGPK
jgi:hypothetical protein